MNRRSFIKSIATTACIPVFALCVKGPDLPRSFWAEGCKCELQKRSDLDGTIQATAYIPGSGYRILLFHKNDSISQIKKTMGSFVRSFIKKNYI